MKRNKWFLTAVLGCLSWTVFAWAAFTSNASYPFGADRAFSDFVSSSCHSQVAVLGAFVTVLGLLVAMVTEASPLHTESSVSEKNHGNGQNGASGNGRQTSVSSNVEADVNQIYRQILEGAKDLIYEHDLEGRFTLINPSGLKLLGYDADEVKHLNVNQVVAPEYRGVLRRVLETDLVNDDCAVCELSLVTKEGRRRMVEISARVVRSDDGRVKGIQGIARDVTTRKLAEAAATEGSELLKALLENSRELIYFKDRASRLVHYSKSLARHVGVEDTNSLQTKSDFDLFTRDHAQAAYEDEQEVMRTGVPIVGKLEVETHKDGRVTYAKTTKLPWRDKGGKVIGIVGITTDVTALMETERKLAAEQQLLQTLLDTFPDNIYFKDLESRLVRVSKSKVATSLEIARDLHLAEQPSATEKELPEHLASEEAFARYLIGRTDFDTFDEQFARQAFEEERSIVQTGIPVIGKLECTQNRDGSRMWMLVTKMPWRDSDGNIIGTFGMSRDVTVLKEAQTELEVTHKHLVHASRMAGMAEVATDVLHNVGNVLNSVNVSCSLVIDRVEENSYANLVKIAEMLRLNTGRLEEFLTVDPRGRHIPGYLDSLAQTFDEQRKFLLHELNQLRTHIDHIKQIVAMQQSYAKVSGIEETIEVRNLVDDALRINADALTRHAVVHRREYQQVGSVYVDKHKVLQILVNLIRNAKYALSDSPRRDKLMTLRILKAGENRVQIQVSDNGTGIAPENLTRIFAHGFTTRKDGHGFGLHSGALAAQELGGSLTASSEGVGKGATFTLELPLKRSQPSP